MCKSVPCGIRNGAVGALAVLATSVALAQAPAATNPAPAPAGPATPTAEQRITELSREVEALKTLVRQLQDQVARVVPAPTAPQPASGVAPASAPTSPLASATAPAPSVAAQTAAVSPNVAADFLRGMTLNAVLDGYYEYNFNAPIGRVNYLRAYDVSSNNFSLNQADLVVESAPDLAAGKRVGMRVDLQYGQATATLQGNPANELRPEVYRSVFQAYGTYVFPLAKGLTIDFGKWASSLGIEGNYTKDQLNYTRSYWFDFLPFYHTGLRGKYAVTDQVAVNVWITNGTQQTEAFNNYKDQLLGIVWTPLPALAWTFNYYRGQEHPDVLYVQNPGAGQTNLPNQQGTYFAPIANPPNGKLQIGDSYISWQASPALTLAAEADYVEQRLYTDSAPLRVTGGALYAGYQLTSKFALAARAEYLADHGGLYSGASQYLREGTLTLDYRPADGFLMRGEFRRDQSNQAFFLSHTLGVLETAQPTIGLGLIWWMGQKEGAW